MYTNRVVDWRKSMIYPYSLTNDLFKQIKNKQLEGFLPGNGNKNAQIMFIGEAPGKTEIETQIPFSGRAGEILDDYLKKIAIKRRDIYITSTLRSRPYKVVSTNQGMKYPNRKPTASELILYSPLLDYEIESINPKLIITLGDTALKRIVDQKKQISNVHGQLLYQGIKKLEKKQKKYIYTKKKYYIFPLFHPAAIFYNSKLKTLINFDLYKLKSIIDSLNIH